MWPEGLRLQSVESHLRSKVLDAAYFSRDEHTVEQELWWELHLIMRLMMEQSVPE